MRSSNVRSVSFTFHKNPNDGGVEVERKPSGKGEATSESTRKILQSSTRQRLQDRFDQECPYSLSRDQNQSSQNKCNRSNSRNWSDFNISLPAVQPRRMLRSGADKISKTLATVRNSIDTLSQVSLITLILFFRSIVFLFFCLFLHNCVGSSLNLTTISFQRFRTSTRRRYRLENESPQAVTPRTRTRCMLGRTPTKLYSPFGIETPQSDSKSLANKENQSWGGKVLTPRRR